MVVGVFILAIIIVVAVIILITKRKSKIHSLTDYIYRVSSDTGDSGSQNKPECELKEKETTTKTSTNVCDLLSDLKSDSALGCIESGKQETTDIVPTEAQSSEVSTL